MPRSLSRRSLLAAAFCQAPPDGFVARGRWEATASGYRFGGTWQARGASDPQECDGLWTLVRQPGGVILEGTWNARKRRGAWEGGWTARINGGARYSGAWKAAVRLPPDAPLLELFESALAKPVSGTWVDSARRSGAWTFWKE
jgi:hypothetical protein